MILEKQYLLLMLQDLLRVVGCRWHCVEPWAWDGYASNRSVVNRVSLNFISLLI